MRSPFSLTGLGLDTGLSLAVGLLAPYGLMLRYWRMGFNPSSQGAIFLFFILVFAVNGLVSLIARRFELSRADLVLVYSMLLMAVTLPTWGLMFFLIGTMVFPYYYATTENRYAELFHDLIPSWMVPQPEKAPVETGEALVADQQEVVACGCLVVGDPVEELLPGDVGRQHEAGLAGEGSARGVAAGAVGREDVVADDLPGRDFPGRGGRLAAAGGQRQAEGERPEGPGKRAHPGNAPQGIRASTRRAPHAARRRG